MTLVTKPIFPEQDLTDQIIGAAIEVHSALGSGLLESTYQACLAHELNLRGLSFEIEKSLPVIYKGLRLDQGYRVDLVVAGRVVVELKAVPQIQSIHEAQLLTYLKLSGIRVGLLINFNTKRLKDGIRRFVVG
jgi:GxxExxY protein